MEGREREQRLAEVTQDGRIPLAILDLHLDGVQDRLEPVLVYRPTRVIDTATRSA